MIPCAIPSAGRGSSSLGTHSPCLIDIIVGQLRSTPGISAEVGSRCHASQSFQHQPHHPVRPLRSAAPRAAIRQWPCLSARASNSCSLTSDALPSRVSGPRSCPSTTSMSVTLVAEGSRLNQMTSSPSPCKLRQLRPQRAEWRGQQAHAGVGARAARQRVEPLQAELREAEVVRERVVIAPEMVGQVLAEPRRDEESTLAVIGVRPGREASSLRRWRVSSGAGPARWCRRARAGCPGSCGCGPR